MGEKRAIPGLELWRPADAREVVVAWRRALERDDGPVALALTRQSVPVLEADDVEQRARFGGYVVEAERQAGAPEAITAFGTAPHHDPPSSDERRTLLVRDIRGALQRNDPERECDQRTRGDAQTIRSSRARPALPLPA